MDTPHLDALAVRGTAFDHHFAEDLSPQSVQHAWWTGRFQFPLDAARQQHEPAWLPWLANHNIATTLLYDPATKLPLRPEQFSTSLAVTLEDVPGLHPDRDVPQFVRAAVARLQQMAQSAAQSELLWIHAGGLPIDQTSPIYEEQFGDDVVAVPAADSRESSEDEEESPDFPPRFWRRKRASPRELADAQLRGTGWQTEKGVQTQVDWQRRRELYAGQVAQWDAWIGRILQTVTELRKQAPVLLIFTAASGEHLGEHAGLESPDMFEEQIHVPLIVELPLDEALSGRRHELTQAVDIPSTLLDWFDVVVPSGAGIDGSSLLPVIRDDQPLERDAAYLGNEAFAGVRTEDFYFRLRLQSASLEQPEMIFLKPDDRWDADNMVRQFIDPADELNKKWHEFVSGIRGRQ